MEQKISIDFDPVWQQFCVKAREEKANDLIYRDGGMVVEIILDRILYDTTVSFSRYDTVLDYFMDLVPEDKAKTLSTYIGNLIVDQIHAVIPADTTLSDIEYRYAGRLKYAITIKAKKMGGI